MKITQSLLLIQRLLEKELTSLTQRHSNVQELYVTCDEDESDDLLLSMDELEREISLVKRTLKMFEWKIQDLDYEKKIVSRTGQ